MKESVYMKKHLISVLAWFSKVLGGFATKLSSAQPHITESTELMALTKGLYVALNASIATKKLEFEYNVTDFSSQEFNTLYSGLIQHGFSPEVIERDSGEFIILNLKQYFGPRIGGLTPPCLPKNSIHSTNPVSLSDHKNNKKRAKTEPSSETEGESTTTESHDVIYVDFQTKRKITTKSAS